MKLVIVILGMLATVAIVTTVPTEEIKVEGEHHSTVITFEYYFIWDALQSLFSMQQL